MPRNSNNVRRIDFVKSGTSAARGRADRTPGVGSAKVPSSERDCFKVVHLPQARMQRRRQLTPFRQGIALLSILLAAAVAGAVMAVMLIDLSF